MIVKPGLRRFSGGLGVSGALATFGFHAPLSDAGSGAVTTTLARGTGSPTFTRATTATTVDSAGLIVSVASGTARSYYDPTTLAYMGYLSEGASTNLCLQSEVFDNASWTKTNSTISSNATTSPDGSATADKLIENAAGVVPHYVTSTAGSITAGATLTAFVYVKAAERAKGRLEIRSPVGNGGASVDWNVTTGTVSGGAAVGTGTYIDSTITAYPSGWYRVTLTATAVPADVTAFVRCFTLDNAGTRDYTGDGTSGVYLWGAQLEEATFASSYIPTTTVAVTRNADVDSYPTASNIVVAQGSIYLEYTPQHAPSGTIFLFGTYVDASNYTAILHDATNLIFRKRIVGVNTDATIANAFVSGTTYKMAASWGTAGMSIVLNGTVGTPHANTASAQIAATMQLGADGNSASQPYAALEADRIWTAQLPDTTLQALMA